MPVDLPTPPPDVGPEVRPPRPLVWLSLGVIVVGIGAALTFWQWPKGASTHDWHFWGWLSVIPAVVFALLFAVRWHFYEQVLLQREALSRQHLRAAEHNVSFAQRPLGLLASTYITAMGSSGVDQRVIWHDSVLGFQPVRGIGESVSHTLIVCQSPAGLETEKRRTRRNALPLSDDDVLELFGRLIESLMPTLGSVPKGILVPVILEVCGIEFPLDVGKQWRKAWQSFGLGEMAVDMQPAEAGVMMLDEWMDETDRSRERIALFVNVQFRDDPPDNSCEAATALLVAWPGRANRLHLPVLAWLHRPVRASLAKATDALLTALKWGDVPMLNDTQIWTSGLKSESREIVTRALNQSCQELKLADITDIDASLGDAGSVAGWLAYALATEQIRTTGKPQFVATQDEAGAVYGVIRASLPDPTEPRSP